MSNLVVVASPNSYAASLGAILDAHALLGELYESNRSLSHYSQLHTGLRLITPDGAAVALAGGRTLAADGGLASAGEVRLVYLPAFEIVHLEHIEAALSGSAPLWAWLKERHDEGAVVAAAGASVWHVAKAGLFGQTRASVEVRLAQAFRRAFPQVQIEPLQAISTGGPVMTCGAAAQEHEFIARVLALALSPNVADWITMRWTGASETASPADPLVARAQLWIRERFTDAFRIQDLAATLSVSHQTLIRRFRQALGVTPREYAQALRIQAAQMMLRETMRSVAEIAALVGYSDLPTFRAVFLAHVGQTPSAYRAAARPAPKAHVKIPP